MNDPLDVNACLHSYFLKTLKVSLKEQFVKLGREYYNRGTVSIPMSTSFTSFIGLLLWKQ